MATAPAAPSIFCAIDRADADAAFELAGKVATTVAGLKLGLEFFTANGPEGVRRMARLGLPVFLDLKLHDIPNTVAGAVRSIADLPVTLTTLHAQGGRAMLEAAVEARDRCRRDLRLLAVTLLTSLSEADLRALGIDGDPEAQVLRLAELALGCGVDGLVCSPREIAALRARFGTAPLLVVPGIRAAPGADDQQRTLTPEEAVRLGADHLVVGRPITAATDPAEAARAMIRRLQDRA